MGELNDILGDLESSLGPMSGQPVALDGGITNRNYQVTLGGNSYVVRRAGRDTELLGIDREAERLAGSTAAELGIAPAVAGVVGGCLVNEFVACHALSSRDVADGVEEIAPMLRAFHDSDVRLPVSFWVGDLLARYAEIVASRGGELPTAYSVAVRSTASIEAVLQRDDPRPAHNDLLAGNLIRARANRCIMLVDWEYAGMGDARFDLGNLSVNNGFGERENERLLRAYLDETPADAQRAVLALMRVLSDAREGAWGVVQGVLSELDFDFGAYASEHLERLCDAVAQPDFTDCLAAAQGAGRW
jgi:thiamine kinase-like enzyme